MYNSRAGVLGPTAVLCTGRVLHSALIYETLNMVLTYSEDLQCHRSYSRHRCVCLMGGHLNVVSCGTVEEVQLKGMLIVHL